MCECEDKDEEPGPPKSKRRKMSQREEKESMVDEIVQELKEKNDENYSETQYRLWTHLILFSGTKTPKVTPEELIITAAAAIAEAVNVVSSQTTIVRVAYRGGAYWDFPPPA